MPDDVVSRLAPCGLHCGACLAFTGGPVQTQARGILDALGPNFAPYAERFKAVDPIFGDHPAFARFLEYLAQGKCTGCRGTGCLFEACRVPECARKNQVDFCFQCPDFPCEVHGLPPRLADIWLKNNERMKTEGVRKFYYWIKRKPRYP